MPKKPIYDRDFYEHQMDDSAYAAAKFVPQICELFRPKTVLDVGCGVGYWLAQFKECGVPTVHGIDGDWVSKDQLKIPTDAFSAFDFGNAKLPFDLKPQLDKYDIVTTFEFLEHISSNLAPALVDFMCFHTDIVVAGAAVPQQGGLHHVNEQWPNYWAALFAERGFRSYDILRPAFAQGGGNAYWYAQNTIVYLRNRPTTELKEKMWAMLERSWAYPAPFVHKDLFIGALRKHSAKEKLRDFSGRILRKIALTRNSNKSADAHDR